MNLSSFPNKAIIHRRENSAKSQSTSSVQFFQALLWPISRSLTPLVFLLRFYGVRSHVLIFYSVWISFCISCNIHVQVHSFAEKLTVPFYQGHLLGEKKTTTTVFSLLWTCGCFPLIKYMWALFCIRQNEISERRSDEIGN